MDILSSLSYGQEQEEKEEKRAEQRYESPLTQLSEALWELCVKECLLDQRGSGGRWMGECDERWG
ncbi:hypothetical protein E2C01_068009 [Portunus trituberculatus]|uniref:Uncharacterized protein n=1 Tax=Portunus trituberculatus TaxID=210409 RepID=A0A5B7HYY3_PORTR|nr:hypothetical protein [Portunus trituberculatus]